MKLYLHIVKNIVANLFRFSAFNTSTSSSTYIPTTSRTTYATTSAPKKTCSCIQTDSYGYTWKTGEINETTAIIQDCNLGVPTATGSASWICDYNGGKCKFDTSQPDYSGCSSAELNEILESVK